MAANAATKNTAENAPAAEKTVAPDPGPLSFSDVEPTAMFGRASSGSSSRFTEALQESYLPVGESDGEQPGKVKQFTCTEEQRDGLIQSIRSEAGRLGIGVTVRHKTVNGTTTIQFQSKVKATRKTSDS